MQEKMGGGKQMISFFGEDARKFNDGDILTATVTSGEYGSKKVTFSGVNGSVSKFSSGVNDGDQFIVIRDSVEGRDVMKLEKL